MAVWLDGVRVEEQMEKRLTALATLASEQEETNRLLMAIIVGMNALAPEMTSVALEGE